MFLDSRRVLKNRPPPAGPKIDLNKLPLRISSSNKKESVHSVTGAIGTTFSTRRHFPRGKQPLYGLGVRISNLIG